MSLNDMINSAKGMMDNAKDLNMSELAKYKDMSKEELIEELKNSEHKDAVVAFIKDLISKKSSS